MRTMVLPTHPLKIFKDSLILSYVMLIKMERVIFTSRYALELFLSSLNELSFEPTSTLMRSGR